MQSSRNPFLEDNEAPIAKTNTNPFLDNEMQENGKDYLDKLPPSESFMAKLPRNILIGLARGGHSTLNMPHDLVSVIENRLGDISEKIGEPLKNLPTSKQVKISDYIYQQPDYNFAEMLGQKGEGTLMDKIISGSVQYLPEILGGSGLVRGGIKRLTGTHQLEKVEEAAKKFGGKNFRYSSATEQEAQKYLPKTEATRQLFNKSAAGEYPASFSMQSQLGKHERDLYRSPLAAERLLAPELTDLKRSMVTQLDQALRGQGMHAEADMLREGIQNYGQYMRVKNAVIPIAKKLGIPMGLIAFGIAGLNKGRKLFKE